MRACLRTSAPRATGALRCARSVNALRKESTSAPLSAMDVRTDSQKDSDRRQAEVLRRLRTRLQDKDLVIIVGAGITLNATADPSGQPLTRLTWAGLIQNGLDYLVDQGYVDPSYQKIKTAYENLGRNEANELLLAASTMTAQMRLSGQLPTWLESVFGNLAEEIRHPEVFQVLRSLHEMGVMLLSTNYDDLLERACGMRGIGRSNKDELLRFKSRDLDGVLHVHGCWDDPNEVVLDSTDYYQVIRSDEIQNILKTFLEYKTILFLGCGSGLEDPNFSALLKWAGDRHENVPNRHCLLVRDADTISHKLLIRLKYGEHYSDLVPFLQQLLDYVPTSSQSTTVTTYEPSMPSVEIITKWLSPVEPQEFHKRLGKVRAKGSGAWFLKRASFRNWFYARESSFLWLRGITGAGKTVLMTTVIDNLMQIADIERGVGYFYCSFADDSTQSTANIFGSILAQLSNSAPPLVDQLVARHRRSKVDASRQAKPPSLDEIVDMIWQHAQTRRIYIAIDAVNEASEPLEVLVKLRQLSQSPRVHIIISSTSGLGIEEFLHNVPYLAIETLGVADIQGDVSLYIHSFIESHYRMRGFPAESKDRIARGLTFGNQGMFRWVQCQMVRLADLRTPGAIEKALETLPPTLDKTYEEILNRIPEDDRELARQVLLLLTYSLRPLSLTEIIEALQITAGLPHLDDSKLLLNPKDAVDVCGGLVTFNDYSKIVTMAHHSVKTYLTGLDPNGSLGFFRLSEEEGHRTLTELCLTYMSFDAFASGPCDTIEEFDARMRHFRFLEYSGSAWAIHARKLSKGNAPMEVMKRFFGVGYPRRGHFTAWVQQLLPGVSLGRIRRTPPLYYAASFGLTSVVDLLLDMGADIEEAGGRHGATPLCIAAYRGHVDTVRLLLERGGDPFEPDEAECNSIEWALNCSHHEVVEVIDAWIHSEGGAHLRDRYYADGYASEENSPKLPRPVISSYGISDPRR